MAGRQDQHNRFHLTHRTHAPRTTRTSTLDLSHIWAWSCSRFDALIAFISALAPAFWTAELKFFCPSSKGTGIQRWRTTSNNKQGRRLAKTAPLNCACCSRLSKLTHCCSTTNTSHFHVSIQFIPTFPFLFYIPFGYLAYSV